MLADVRSHLPRLLPYVRLVLQRVCVLAHGDYLSDQTAWNLRWKHVSHDGFDVYQAHRRSSILLSVLVGLGPLSVCHIIGSGQYVAGV